MPEEPTQPYWERAFRSLLWRAQPPQLQQHVDRLLDEVQRAVTPGTSADEAFANVYQQTRRQIVRQLVDARRTAPGNPSSERRPSSGSATRRLETLLDRELDELPDPASPDFHCDAGLGGLARWLRAGGYDARWWDGIDDDDLLAKMHRSAAILLTNDTRLADRGVIKHGVVPALLVPIQLVKHDQFAFALKTLDLPRKTPRCMACGGTLEPVPKQQVRDRIPPRTYPWLDDYHQCRRCGKLFWEGTHWQHIDAQLNNADARRNAR